MLLVSSDASPACQIAITRRFRAEGQSAKAGNERGLALLGLLAAMVVAALLAGGGITLMRRLPQAEFRATTAEYLDEVRRAVFIRLRVYGSLPPADTDGDGLPNAPSQPSPVLADTTKGTLPYVSFGVKPRDEWGRVLKYEVHPGLVSTRPTLEQRKKDSCLALQAGLMNLSGAPQVWDGGAAAIAVAVLVAGGPRDADGDGTAFDAIAGKGDNSDGNPYLRHAPYPEDGETTFDDLTVFVSPGALADPKSLLGWLKVNDPRFDWLTTCQYTHCHNVSRDVDETGVNCGGLDCDPCP